MSSIHKITGRLAPVKISKFECAFCIDRVFEIIYESKFKYIYRYFIKIDRCFCEILQSLPLRKCGLKSSSCFLNTKLSSVTSLAEVWIEIAIKEITDMMDKVTSLAEVWIEIFNISVNGTSGSVTSLAEVWIEMFQQLRRYDTGTVTSLAEVWIEIILQSVYYRIERSLPLRKCGLKSRGF